MDYWLIDDALFWRESGTFVWKLLEKKKKALRLFPDVLEIKIKQMKCLNLLLKRKDVLGLLPTWFGKSLIY